jgi:ABC-type polysaccharide/polyol phosphate export permease
VSESEHSVSKLKADRFKKTKHELSLVMLLVRRELKVKYRGSFLGYLWSMLNPLLFMLIISTVFKHIVKNIPDYHLYVLSGILAWNAISLSLAQGAQSIVMNASLLRKVKTPAYLFPLVPIGSSLTNMCLALVPFSAVMLFSGRHPGVEILWLPFLIMAQAVFLYGAALTLGCLNVFFRDVGHVLEPLLTVAFYATPIIFDRASGIVPPKLQFLLSFNPFVHFVEAFRVSLIGYGSFSIERGFLILGLALASFGLGLLTYKLSRRKIIFYV